MSLTSTQDKSGPFLVTANAQVIPVGFPFQQASDLLVLDTGASGTAYDPAKALVLGSDYTVSAGGYNGANQMQTGSITISTSGQLPVAVNDYVVIMRNVPINQTQSFTATGPATIELLEQGLDKQGTLSQQVNEVASRSLQFEASEFISGVMQRSQRAGNLLGFNAGGGLEWYTPTSASAVIPLGAGILNVKNYGAQGNGINDDTAAFTACIAALVTQGGGVCWVPPGTYAVSTINITSSGIIIQGASMQGTIFTPTVATATNFLISVNLSGTGPKRPLDFGLYDCTLKGLSEQPRYCNGLSLNNVYSPDVRRVYFSALTDCLLGNATFFGTFEDFWFEYYTVGISGASPGDFNTNTFTGMNFFDGSPDGIATPINTTYMDNCVFVNPSFAASASNPAGQLVLAGSDNVFIAPRFESWNSTTDWVAISGVRHKIRDPLITWAGGQGPASGKFVFNISGNSNVIDGISLDIGQQLVYCGVGTSDNKITFSDPTVCGNPVWQAIVDFGSDNLVNFGINDHTAGSGFVTTLGVGPCWSDGLVENLWTHSVNFADLTADGLTVAASSDAGPISRGYVWTISAPTGNQMVYQAVDSGTATNACYCFSFYAKSVSSTGHTENVSVFMDTSHTAANLGFYSYPVRDDTWTRIVFASKNTVGSGTWYAGIKLGASSNGLLIAFPQVNALGSTSASGEITQCIPGGWIPTASVARTAISPDFMRGSNKFQGVAAPSHGTWAIGDIVWSLVVTSSGTPPGWICTTAPATFTAFPNLA